MDKISFRLDVFEGPLDLLLHLIAKHKLNINDIEISKLLEQYLAYIDECHMHDLEVAGEFLEMAARLIYIKTVSLLPKPNPAEQLKKELQGSLIEYSVCKAAAARLSALFTGDDIFSGKRAIIKTDCSYKRSHSSLELSQCFELLSERIVNMREIQNKNNNKFNVILNHKMVTVMTKVVFIMKKLYSSGSVNMDSLYDGITDRSERVATFLAVLELTKVGHIRLNDDNSVIFFSGRPSRYFRK